MCSGEFELLLSPLLHTSAWFSSTSDSLYTNLKSGTFEKRFSEVLQLLDLNVKMSTTFLDNFILSFSKLLSVKGIEPLVRSKTSFIDSCPMVTVVLDK